MESVIIDKIEVKEKYVSNGNNKTRVHIIRAMSNNGSQFVNYKCGRNSVNISKNAIKDVTEKINQLNWEHKQQEQTANSNEQTLLEHIKQLQKQINQLKEK